MAYRRIELNLPGHGDADLAEIVKPAKVFDRAVLRDSEDRARVALIIDADQTEQVLDKLEKQWGEDEQFLAIVTPVAALAPRPDVDDDGTDDDGDGEQESSDKPQTFGRISRGELLDDLETGTHITAIYIASTLLSCLVAAIGMMKDDVAVVIAAMVIAPLLTPNMSLALGTTLADLTLIRKALVTNAAGLAAALVFAVGLGLVLPIDLESRQLVLRTTGTLWDVGLAIAAGTAGALAVTSGLGVGLIGVMVAVALVPPLVAVGLLLGSGYPELAAGAGLLTLINVVAVNLSAVSVFALQGIRPQTWQKKEHARRSTAAAVVLWLLLLASLAVLLMLWDRPDLDKEAKGPAPPPAATQPL
jgi:uncharacterized hydrophobic protein (TIGR00341 family)